MNFVPIDIPAPLPAPSPVELPLSNASKRLRKLARRKAVAEGRAKQRGRPRRPSTLAAEATSRYRHETTPSPKRWQLDARDLTETVRLELFDLMIQGVRDQATATKHIAKYEGGKQVGWTEVADNATRSRAFEQIADIIGAHAPRAKADPTPLVPPPTPELKSFVNST